jgi:predicted patatin/cPLA2 family phospholipase
MTIAWKPNEFKIAVNMAGAVSAGAYTAGVLDFLMKAQSTSWACHAVERSLEMPI